jgi:hypothetical protein
MIFEPVVRSSQIMNLSCAEINYHVPSGVPKAISMPMVHLAQTMHLSCAEIKTISKHIEMSFRLIHVT